MASCRKYHSPGSGLSWGRAEEGVPSKRFRKILNIRQPQVQRDGEVAGLAANPWALGTQALPMRPKEVEMILGKRLTWTGTWMQKLQFLFQVTEWRPAPGGEEVQSKTSGFGAKAVCAQAQSLLGDGGPSATELWMPAILPASPLRISGMLFLFFGRILQGQSSQPTFSLSLCRNSSLSASVKDVFATKITKCH